MRVIKTFVQNVRVELARIARIGWTRLPDPMKAGLRGTGEVAWGRRRSLVLPMIVLAHLGLFIWLGQIKPPPGPVGEFVMDVSLFPGETGGGSSAALPSITTETASSSPETPVEDTPEQTEPSSEPPTKAAEPAQTPLDPTQITIAAVAEPAAPVDNPDVLAMVETMTGVTTEAVAQPAQASTPVSSSALAWVQSRAGPGGGCDINVSMQERLTADPAAQAALRLVPRDAKSVANAIQLWDGAWIPIITTGDDAAFAPVRDVIADAVRTAPADCRNRAVEGPRFLIVANAEGLTTVIVVGSGTWRWADLVKEERPALMRWFGL